MSLAGPRGKQAWSILDSTARLNIWEGSVRSGKTVGSLLRFLHFIADGPPGPLLMVGKTERTLKRNILDILAEWLSPDDFRLASGSGECWIYGRRVLIASANDERSEGKIRGLTLAGAYGDELTLWPESFFAMLLSRLSVKGAKFFGTTNTDGPRHWLKVKYLDRESELDLARFKFRIVDNPNLDPVYVENLTREYVGLWRRRYIDGAWALAEGAVYDMFDPARHVVRDFPKLGQHYGGGDYGTSNPTVFLSLSEHLCPEGAHWLCHDEWRWDSRDEGRQMTDADYSAAYQTWTGEVSELRGLPRWPKATLIDPSAASFRLQLVRDGVPGVASADNAVLDGIRDVSTLLGNGRLAFHGPTTQATIDEMTGYSWDPAAQQRGEDKPIKVDDHGPDTLRYLVRRVTRLRGKPRAKSVGRSR